uniref:Uncharacterized protein n=1 Tax=viral metagenome TaxID=1070528 RepID=A0A6C0HHK8_9ZZZZ
MNSGFSGKNMFFIRCLLDLKGVSIYLATFRSSSSYSVLLYSNIYCLFVFFFKYALCCSMHLSKNWCNTSVLFPGVDILHKYCL